MSSAATINVQTLLAPIPEGPPAGIDLREDVSPKSIYYRLKDARSSARAAERRADAEGGSEGMAAEWQTILALAPTALAESSKDLEIAVWLIEGLVRSCGFAGLRDGFKLAHGLLDRYWDDFFSIREDEEGLATRLAPLAGLNGTGTAGTLMQPLRKVPLTRRGDAGSFAFYHYEQALALANVVEPNVRGRREAAGEVSMERFLPAVTASGGGFYVTLLGDLDENLAALASLEALLHERAGRDAPPTSDLRALLTTIRDAVAHFSADLVARATAQAESEASPEGAASNGAAREPAAAGMSGGREEALRTLMQVAEYFRKSEPHSPISMSLDEIVRRAHMPFAELLLELLPDPTSWRSALTSAGIKPPPESSG